MNSDPGTAAPVRSRLREMFGLDLRSLALFRIGLALLLLVDLAGRWPDLAAHYSDAGVLPRSIVPIYVPVPLHFLDGSATCEGFLFLLSAAAAVALLVGYRTQLAALFSWLLLLSLHVRNPLVLHGGDLLERMLLFWAIFLPLGARWSLDAARTAGVNPSARPVVCSAATVALLLQVAFMYGFGAAAKNDPAWLSKGTAIADALSLDFYATPFGRWARDLPPELLRAATFGTVALEGGGAVVLLLSGGLGRVRTALVALFIVFHVMLGLFLRLGTFSLVCVVAWLPFLPSWFWDKLMRRRPSEPAPAADTVPPAAPPLSPLATAVVLLALAYVLLCNWQGLATGFSLSLVRGIGLEQSWGMFAPYPNREDGWYVVVGKLEDGRTVDPFRGAPVSWDKPEMISATYPSARWAAYLSLLPRPGYEPYRPYFADYLGRRWNSEHPGEAIVSIEVYYMLRYIQPDHTTTPPEKALLARLGRE